jgi:hypothetical protein
VELLMASLTLHEEESYCELLV